LEEESLKDIFEKRERERKLKDKLLSVIRRCKTKVFSCISRLGTEWRGRGHKPGIWVSFSSFKYCSLARNGFRKATNFDEVILRNLHIIS